MFSYLCFDGSAHKSRTGIGKTSVNTAGLCLPAHRMRLNIPAALNAACENSTSDRCFVNLALRASRLLFFVQTRNPHERMCS